MTMRLLVFSVLLIGCASVGLAAQTAPPPNGVSAAAKQPVPGEQYSGMYSFLAEGEFVQVSVGDQGKITGFVSRYGDSDSDRGEFLDHFFKEAKLDGDNLTFITATVHGNWYAFKGQVGRGPAKDSSVEGYYVLRGTVTQYSKDAADKVSAREREVVLKRFPDDVTGNSSQPGK